MQILDTMAQLQPTAMILPVFVPWKPTIGAFILLGFVSGQFRNITLDDTDHAITYTPARSWFTGTNEPDCYGAGHHWASEAGAYATFNFTGVAVYYLMALFQGYSVGVSTRLSLDDGPAEIVDLTRLRTEPMTSAVRWRAIGLKNQPHTVVVSLGPNTKLEQESWGQVDAFIYTVPDDSGNQPTPLSPEQSLRSLQTCQPCGKSKCSFSPEGSPSYDTYMLIVGDAVSNCNIANTSAVTFNYQREVQISESWSVDTTIGISFSGLNLPTSGSWSSSATLRAGQQISISIPHGQVAALITAISYKNTRGIIRVGSHSFNVSSLQPVRVMSFTLAYAECGSKVNVSTLSTIECTKSTSGANTSRCLLMLMGLMGITVFWNMI